MGNGCLLSGIGAFFEAMYQTGLYWRLFLRLAESGPPLPGLGRAEMLSAAFGVNLPDRRMDRGHGHGRRSVLRMGADERLPSLRERPLKIAQRVIRLGEAEPHGGGDLRRMREPLMAH